MTGEVGGPSIQVRPDARPVPLVVWAARLSVYFLLQGALLLLAYAYYGFATDPQSFPPGQRLDPRHAAVHLLWGIAGTYVGFIRPRLATPFMLAFAAFYTLFAILGTFTNQHLGMHLDTSVNLFHWSLVFPAWAIGLYGLWRERHPREIVSAGSAYGRLIALYSRYLVRGVTTQVLFVQPLGCRPVVWRSLH